MLMPIQETPQNSAYRVALYGAVNLTTARGSTRCNSSVSVSRTLAEEDGRARDDGSEGIDMRGCCYSGRLPQETLAGLSTDGRQVCCAILLERVLSYDAAGFMSSNERRTCDDSSAREKLSEI